MNADNALSFSASEVCIMTDEELINNFVKICTVSSLQCKHCCKKRNNEFYRKIKKHEMEIKNQEKLLEKLDNKYNEKIHYDCINICNELIKKRMLEGRATGKYKLRELPGENELVVEPPVEPVIFTIPEICKIVNDLDILTKRIQELSY